jgi:hypothetical protein
MQSWRESMPVGMKLKSEGFASNISDPKGALRLGTFCREENIPYADTNLLVSLDTFESYGEAFQRRFVPDLEQKMVVLVEPAPHGFDLHLKGGEVVPARRTVIATGIAAFAYYPPELLSLPKGVLLIVPTLVMPAMSPAVKLSSSAPAPRPRTLPPSCVRGVLM